jgi:uncharacterized protein YbbC (DUF1343 family)
MVSFGIDQLIANNPSWKSSRIAMLTNDAARCSKGKHSRIKLIENQYNLVRLFSPEHGINTMGADGAFISNATDVLSGLEVVSLYQDRMAPTLSELEDIDIMLVDLPDVGVRFYTYLWSMTHFIEVAAQLNKPIIILDRPNPLGGKIELSEGSILDEKCRSFIGRFGLPVTHYCTLGELANYFNVVLKWHADLQVIPCQWKRDQTFKDWGMKWINPSPALQRFDSCQLYPGLCFFEATNLTVGRGSTHSFEWIGAEWFSATNFNFSYEGLTSTILSVEIQVQEIEGVLFNVHDNFKNPVRFGIELLYAIKKSYPGKFKWQPYPTQANPSGKNHLDLLLGLTDSELIFDLPPEAFHQYMDENFKSNWEKKVKPYLLYT